MKVPPDEEARFWNAVADAINRQDARALKEEFNRLRKERERGAAGRPRGQQPRHENANYLAAHYAEQLFDGWRERNSKKRVPRATAEELIRKAVKTVKTKMPELVPPDFERVLALMREPKQRRS